MSRKHRGQKESRHKQKRGFPWVWLAFGGVLALVAFVLFATRGSSGHEGGTPAIAVDPQKIDYGYVKFGNDKTFMLKVSNTGSGTLRFNEKPYIEVLEGC